MPHVRVLGGLLAALFYGGPMEREKKIECLAYHEAGHAVASLSVKRKFEKIVIQVDKSPPGYMEYKSRKTTYKRLEDDIFISLAGPAADVIFTGTPNWYGARFDYENAWANAGLFPAGPEYQPAYVQWAYRQAEGFLRDNWPCVESLAAELKKNNRIYYQKARKLIYEALFPAMPEWRGSQRPVARRSPATRANPCTKNQALRAI